MIEYNYKVLSCYANIDISYKTNEWLDFIEFKRKQTSMNIRIGKFNNLDQWIMNEKSIFHKSKNFFSIEGARAKINYGEIRLWEQPMINQSEVGILGLIIKKFENKIYLLVQFKTEPGNIGKVQLSPTVQATKSNYMRVHKGSSTKYIDYFIGNNKKVLFDKLQSEQGSRFINKKNRNIIIEVNEDIVVEENFYWISLRQIKELTQFNNIVNLDLRSLLCNLNYILSKFSYNIESRNEYELSISTMEGHKNISSIETWLSKVKRVYKTEIVKIDLCEMDQWSITDTVIYNESLPILKVIPIDIESDEREVRKWSQPIFKSEFDDQVVFFIKKINGVYHFLVQANLEIGHLNRVELGPTIQKGLSTINDITNNEIYEYYKRKKGSNVVHFSYQSEEGGRFLYEQNIHMILFVDDDLEIKNYDKFCWMTLGQIYYFLNKYSIVNIEARSLMAVLPTFIGK